MSDIRDELIARIARLAEIPPASVQENVPIRSFDTSAFKHQVGCEVRDFITETPAGRAAPHEGRATRMAIAAAERGLKDAGLWVGLPLEATAVVMGTTLGEPQFLEEIGE